LSHSRLSSVRPAGLRLHSCVTDTAVAFFFSSLLPTPNQSIANYLSHATQVSSPALRETESRSMNVESWQATQKAQKDEERKRKSQAAEALRSYKGQAANAEASKLTQMKEQDRQQKLEAERQHREYRGTISEEDAKLTIYKEEERRKKQEASNLLRGYQGTLSEEEARLAAVREEERRKKQQAQEQLYQNLERSKAGNTSSADEAIAPGSVSAIAGVFDGMCRVSIQLLLVDSVAHSFAIMDHAFPLFFSA
jgi:hypothetical protein